MNRGNIKFATKRQFDTVLKKEGITLTDYYDKTEYLVFFRKNNRGTNPQGKVRIFYSQDTPINIGTVFVLKDCPYVVISRDGDESDIYYTSMAMKCDTSLTTYVSGEGYITVPFVTVTDKYTLQSNSTVSLISGCANCYTGLNKYSQDIEVNDTFYNYGGYYKVGNYFWNNGLCYIYMTREATPNDSYTLTYDGDTSFDMAITSTYQLSYLAMNNLSIVDNPTLSYVSSNTDVATVDENGLMTILSTGETTITATWTDGDNTTCSTVITITNGEDSGSGDDSGSTDTPTVTLTITFKGSQELKIGGTTKTLTAKYTDSDGNDISANYTTVWTVTSDDFDVDNTSLLEITESGNTLKLQVPDNDETYNTQVTVTAVDADGLFTPYSLVFDVVSMF